MKGQDACASKSGDSLLYYEKAVNEALLQVDNKGEEGRNKKKHTELALETVNNALALDSDLRMLKIEIDALRKDGHVKEALAAYEELLEKNAKISDDAFNRQINQLRILNDLNDKNEQESALLYQNEQLLIRQKLLLISVSFVVVLLFVLYFLAQYYRRTSRLKDELLSEKNALVASERLLQQARDEAEKANQQKTAFLANISHEVRTPLNAIVGFSELLAENTYKEDERIEFATTINKNSEILMNLVNDVLDMSRLESANSNFTFTVCDIVARCRDIVENMKEKVTEGVRLTFVSPVESFELSTDENRIRQLLNKLLLNAAKFTCQGEINLSIELDQKMNIVRFIVTDTGCGIPLEKQGLIFERFEKLDDFVQGTGLGLPICQLIALKLGGHLSIDPNYKEGARFVFVHPIVMSS